jgi:hypothetical protein
MDMIYQRRELSDFSPKSEDRTPQHWGYDLYRYNSRSVNLCESMNLSGNRRSVTFPEMQSPRRYCNRYKADNNPLWSSNLPHWDMSTKISFVFFVPCQCIKFNLMLTERCSRWQPWKSMECLQKALQSLRILGLPASSTSGCKISSLEGPECWLHGPLIRGNGGGILASVLLQPTARTKTGE